MRYVTSPLARVLLAAMLLTAVGCSMSKDQQPVTSTRARPANASVVDTATDTVLWHMEIPIGHNLWIDYEHRGMEYEGIRVSEAPATHMTWELYQISEAYRDPDQRVGEPVAEGELELTGNEVRTVWSHRGTVAVSGAGLYRIEQYRRPDDATAQSTQTPGNIAETQPATQPAEQ